MIQLHFKNVPIFTKEDRKRLEEIAKDPSFKPVSGVDSLAKAILSDNECDNVTSKMPS